MKRLLLALALAVAPATASAESSRLVDVVVVMRSQANLASIRQATRPARLAEVERTLRAHATRAQRGVLALLAKRQVQHVVAQVTPLWIANEVEVQATPAVIKELAARPDVQAVRPNFTIQAPAAPASGTASTTTVEPNVNLVNAPAMWANGLRGQGIVVANMDTGVDATHPDLAAKWRGGTNSWYDPMTLMITVRDAERILEGK